MWQVYHLSLCSKHTDSTATCCCISHGAILYHITSKTIVQYDKLKSLYLWVFSYICYLIMAMWGGT